MNLTIPTPRLLPVTIAAIAALFAMKSVDIVRAAVPTGRMNVMLVATAAEKEAAPRPAADPPPPGRSVGVTPGSIVAPPATAPAQAGPPPVTDGEKSVLLELRQRRQDLDTRETTVKQRESVLTAAEGRLTARVDELQVLQTRLEALEAGRKQREDASWQGLVKLYETMKPRDAATIFNDLPMPTLLPIVDRMKDAKAAAILATMNPDKARDVTAQLAQLRLRAAAGPDDRPVGTATPPPAGMPPGPARPNPPGG
jgi:flagellar motility protein MotE (MotC chaperone)